MKFQQHYVENWVFDRNIPGRDVDIDRWINISSNCYAADYYTNCYLSNFKSELPNPRLDPFIADQMQKGTCGKDCCVYEGACCEQEGSMKELPPLKQRKKEEFIWMCSKGNPDIDEYTCCWPQDIKCYDYKCNTEFKNLSTVSPYIDYDKTQSRTVFKNGGLGAIEIIAIVLFSLFLFSIIGCVLFQNKDQSKTYLKKRKEKRYF